MTEASPIRLLVVHTEADTPAVLKSLLRGRMERPYTIDATREIPASADHAQYDVLILECDASASGSDKNIIVTIRRSKTD